MLKFPYDIKGGSILLIIDHKEQSCIIKLIDFATINKYDDEDQRDSGFIVGC